jgi:hypothetical protein
MHKAIFSDRERHLLRQFIDTGEVKDATFRMLKLRIKRAYPTIEEDFQMIEKLRDKI